MKKTIHTVFLVILTLGLFAQSEIMPPELVAPTDGKANQMPDVTLDWNAVSGVGVVTYEIEVDTSDQFTNPILFETNLSSVKTENLLFGTLYNWRVRATDNIGTSDWSDVFTFTTFDEVLLQSPTNAATGQVPNVKLQWKKQANQGVVISGITYYEYQVSADTAFTGAPLHQVSFASFASTDPFHFSYANQLLFNTEYFWRVRAKHDFDITEWSEVRNFTTIDKVALTEPANNAADQMLDVKLKWTDVSGTFGYMYELCTDPNFSFPCLSITDTNVIVPEVLEFGETYYWRVKTYHDMDTTEWSDARNFSTINVVTPVSPENGSLVPDLLPKLKWEEITGISKYEVLYDVSDNFTDPVGGLISPNLPEYQIQFVLEKDITYYWKVRAIQDGDTSNWSPTWSFTPYIPSGIENEVLAKSNVNIFPNPSSGELAVTVNSFEPIEVEVKVYDLLGQVFYENTVVFDPARKRLDLDLNNLSKGMYILNLSNGASIYSEKLVIEK